MRARRLAFLSALVALLAVAGGACVDGVTPRCDDPAARCGPSLDGSVSDADAEASTVLPEAGPPDAASDATPDAALDAGGDAPLDAPAD